MAAPAANVGTGRKRRLPVIPHVSQECASFPKALGICSLFTMVPRGQNTDRGSVDVQPVALALIRNRTVEQSGIALDADHQCVMLVLFKMAEGKLPKADYIDFELVYADVLRLLGKRYNTSNRNWLRDKLLELSRKPVHFKNAETGKTVFSGSLISWGDTRYDEPGYTARSRLTVSISKAVLALYESGYGKVNLEQRRRLGSSHLARLLQVELACQPEHHHPYLLNTYLKLFGSESELGSFKGTMKIALDRLKQAGVIEGWEFKASSHGISNPLVVITIPARPKSQKDLNAKAQSSRAPRSRIKQSSSDCDRP